MLLPKYPPTRLLVGLIAGALLVPGLPLAQSLPVNDGASGVKAEQDYFIEVLAERRVTELPPGPLYWQVAEFPTLKDARAAAGPFSLAASAAGRSWLFTLGALGRRSAGGRAIARIGPIVVPKASIFLLRINRAGGPPGSHTSVHTHPGSEAILVLKGQVTQRTPHGVERADVGGTLNAHLPEMVMQLASSGANDLEQLVMFVVDAERPFSPPARF